MSENIQEGFLQIRLCKISSISSVQGWMEGALQTSEDVLELYHKQQQVKKKLPKEYVIYDGRILNVEKWKEVFHIC